ncbi:MAG: polysaccharide export protein EpsE [Sulfuritalea sp.]|nr:polysaccharide export protein EpsE [Sulfuritalea sp.]
MRKPFSIWLACLCLIIFSNSGVAQDKGSTDITLGSGDLIRIVVFQNPDLTVEARVSEAGTVTYPLLGSVKVGGLTLDAAEKQIAKGLRDGGFVPQPQVNISLSQILGNRVSILGMVGKPGRFPLETFNTRLTDILATAGGISPGGDDSVIVIGTRDGKPFRKEIDVPGIYLDSKREDDIVVAGGDIIYVHRAPVYYIYGEVQKPGSFRIERGMTVQQALVQAGGPSARGMERWLRMHRRDKEGLLVESSPELLDPIKPNDVIYVRESFF